MLLFGWRVAVRGPVGACIDCGLPWAEAPARQRKRMLIDADKAETKQRLGL